MTPQHHLPADIERTSMGIITAELAARGLAVPPENAAVVKRVIHTTADFDYAENLRFTPGAAAAGVVTPEGYWLISENGKLLERTDTLPPGCPGITGVEPESPALSAQLSLGEEKTLTTETLLTLVRTAGGYGMLAGIGSVDLSDAEAITFTYLGRFTVRLPWDSDLDYIFRSVQDLVNGLESNETGEINYMLLKSKGEMHFIPSAPGA